LQIAVALQTSVCARSGIENPSAEYLAGYLRRYEATPPISLDAVMKSAWLIEQMGRRRFKLRTEADLRLPASMDGARQ
jgi:hypothetical protein